MNFVFSATTLGLAHMDEIANGIDSREQLNGACILHTNTRMELLQERNSVWRNSDWHQINARVHRDWMYGLVCVCSVWCVAYWHSMRDRTWGYFGILPDPSTLIFCKLVAFSMPLEAATDVGIWILVPGIVIVPVCFCCCADACWFCCCDAACWFVCWAFVCWFCCCDAVCWFVCCVVACWVCGCALTCWFCWFNVLANGIDMFVPGIVNVACPNAAHEICPKYIHFVVVVVVVICVSKIRQSDCLMCLIGDNSPT